jgi:hypothetical protein
MEEKEERRTYEAEVMGVPPLRMVLVHAENERANRTRRPLPKPQQKSRAEREMRELIIRLIESLEKGEE